MFLFKAGCTDPGFIPRARPDEAHYNQTLGETGKEIIIVFIFTLFTLFTYWSRRASAWAARAMYFGCHSVCLSSRELL